jgi:hypothetical protein
MMNKYEGTNMTTYVDGKTDKMVFEFKETPESEAVKEQGTQMCDSLKNPYFNLYHWCKGELSDIEALTNALASKDKLKGRIDAAEKKKKQAQGDLDSVNAGRKTLTTLTKNKSDTGTMEIKLQAVSSYPPSLI